MKTPLHFAEKIWRQEISAADKRLAHLKAEQKSAFDSLKAEFSRSCSDLKRQHTGGFLTQKWAAINARLERALLPVPPFSFTRTPAIKKTMFTCLEGRDLRETLDVLEKNMPPERLRELLLEDYVGAPPLFTPSYLASHNSLAHLRHLVQFSRATKCDTQKIESVIEWGGGYGSFARIFKRHRTTPFTYTIIDSPLFSCLQWLYLATIFGENNVHLLKRPQDAIQPRKINLLPLCFLEGRRIAADLFLSTWALCESSAFSQDYVFNRSWFGAKRLLLAYQTKSPTIRDGRRLHRMALSAGARRIHLGGGGYYAFR